MPGNSAPKPWSQYQTSTTFLRVPAADWAAVKIGAKTEFRATGRWVSQLWNVTCPTPAVGYVLTPVRGHDSRLLVLEETWTEPLGAISPESLEREGFETFGHFRRYWMDRTKRRFTPLSEVRAYRVRPFTETDRGPMGAALLEKLYGQHLEDALG